MNKVLFLILILAPLNWAEETANGVCKDGKDEYCAKCVSDKCTMCYESIVDDAGQCQAVTTAVENCAMYKSKTECLACMPGYTGTTCKAIEVAKCYMLDSSDATKCSMCEGVTPDPISATCEGTACTITDCKSCKGTGDAQTCQYCGTEMIPATDSKSCVAVTKHDNGCTTASSCAECAKGYYVNSASGATMTCAESTRYKSVAILSGVIMSWLAFLKF